MLERDGPLYKYHNSTTILFSANSKKSFKFFIVEFRVLNNTESYPTMKNVTVGIIYRVIAECEEAQNF